MKTIYVVESLSSKGGAENALLNIVLEMKKLGHESIIIYLWGPNDFEEKLNSARVQTYCLGMESRWRVLKGVVRISRILSSKEIILISAINFFPMFYVALSKIFVRGKKRIVTYHNMGYEVYPAKNILKLFRKLIDIILNRYCFEGHLGVSRAISKTYMRHLHIKKIHTIENIIPVDTINKMLAYKPTIHEINKPYRIVMAGRLVPEKGYHYMIQAMEILKNEGVKFHLSIFGDGALKPEIEFDISNRKLSDYIVLSPAVNHSKLFKIIQNSDLFVMSSISEGFPMAPAEAMVIGTPVIATNVGGISELIEDGVSGILVASKSPNQLAESIKNVLTDYDLRSTLSYNGKKRIQDNFSPLIICQKLLNYYSDILDNRPK